MLTRFLDWYLTTDDPSITAIKTFVRANGVCALLQLVRGIAALPRQSARLLRWTWIMLTHPAPAWPCCAAR
jgi:hypothetical protein